jgi:hypothetical protein
MGNNSKNGEIKMTSPHSESIILFVEKPVTFGEPVSIDVIKQLGDEFCAVLDEHYDEIIQNGVK